MYYSSWVPNGARMMDVFEIYFMENVLPWSTHSERRYYRYLKENKETERIWYILPFRSRSFFMQSMRKVISAATHFKQISGENYLKKKKVANRKKWTPFCSTGKRVWRDKSMLIMMFSQNRVFKNDLFELEPNTFWRIVDSLIKVVG